MKTVGFLQGVIYAARMIKEYDLDAYELLKESGLSTSDMKKYGEESDIETLKEEIEALEK